MKTFTFRCTNFILPLFFIVFLFNISFAQDGRSKEGVLDSMNINKLRTYLTHCTGEVFPKNIKIAIVYYPGKDDCNSNSIWTLDEAYIKMSTARFNMALDKLGGTSLINIYKNDEGLELQKKYTTWHPDKDHEIEKLFFNQHYPCYSFVVISPNGNYYSYYGEYADAQIFEALKLTN